MGDLTQPPRPADWRALGRYALTFGAIAAAYHGALHFFDMNVAARAGLLSLVLYGAPAIVGLALTWPFGVWRAATPWRFRIAALGVCAFIVIVTLVVHIVLLFEICGLAPDCQ